LRQDRTLCKLARVAIILDEQDIRAVLPMPDLIEAMQGALVAYSEGRTQQPVRTVLEVGDARSFFGLMPAFIADTPALGAKLVTVFEANVAAGLPTHLATIVLLDPRTGALRGILDGRYITEARTAAVSAVSTRLLARPGAATLAIIGTGVQARRHLEALSCVSSLHDVRIWSRSAERRERFAADMQRHTGARLMAAPSAEAAVASADLIVLASLSRTPVVRNEWIADGAHICAIGACRPDQREMDGALVARARVIVDSRKGALSESGDILLAISEGLFDVGHVAGELGEVAAGRIEGRQTPAQVTVFKSLGMAVEDIAAAHLACERAMARGLGRPL
jgi:ornithine cyclodeaminase